MCFHFYMKINIRLHPKKWFLQNKFQSAPTVSCTCVSRLVGHWRPNKLKDFSEMLHVCVFN